LLTYLSLPRTFYAVQSKQLGDSAWSRPLSVGAQGAGGPLAITGASHSPYASQFELGKLGLNSSSSNSTALFALSYQVIMHLISTVVVVRSVDVLVCYC
jgi:hypothetical protein